MGKVINPDTGQGFRFVNIVGTRNGKLHYVEHLGRNKHKHQLWRAICECGKETVVSSRKSKSCGCLRSETASAGQRAKKQSSEIRAEKYRLNAAKQRARRKTDPLLSMQARLSRLLRHAIKQVGGIKTSPTFESLGYPVDQFVRHIERQFTEGMGWHNMAEWQIDHIVPASSARSLQDVLALNQLSNLRPMWATENNAKKAKRTSLL